MLELLLVTFFYTLALLVVVVYFARTTWACQKREGQAVDAVLAMKLSQSKETIPLAHVALDRAKESELRQSHVIVEPSYDGANLLQN